MACCTRPAIGRAGAPTAPSTSSAARIARSSCEDSGSSSRKSRRSSASHPGVGQAVVDVRREAADSVLEAFVVPAHGARLEATDLRAFLDVRLPGYMVPSRFALLETLPLTPNGKIDRAALPDLPATPASDDRPAGRIEQALATIWTETLGVAPHERARELLRGRRSLPAGGGDAGARRDDARRDAAHLDAVPRPDDLASRAGDRRSDAHRPARAGAAPAFRQRAGDRLRPRARRRGLDVRAARAPPRARVSVVRSAAAGFRGRRVVPHRRRARVDLCRRAATRDPRAVRHRRLFVWRDDRLRDGATATGARRGRRAPGRARRRSPQSRSGAWRLAPGRAGRREPVALDSLRSARHAAGRNGEPRVGQAVAADERRAVLPDSRRTWRGRARPRLAPPTTSPPCTLIGRGGTTVASWS